MTKEGWNLRVVVYRWVRGNSPGWVEARFTDSLWRNWIVIEKAPVLTGANLIEDSQFPQLGYIPCEVISEGHDKRGRPTVVITTERPLFIRSTDGIGQFNVLGSQLVQMK